MNKIGHWSWDSNQLPQYDYMGGYPVSAKDKAGKDAMLPKDPCFILGNHRMTLFAHVSGCYEFITGERGWARMNHGGKNTGWSKSVLTVSDAKDKSEEQSFELTGENRTKITVQEHFGVGYASYKYDCAKQIELTKVLSVQPSLKCGEGNASMLMEIKLENQGKSETKLTYREQVLANYCMMNHQDKINESTGKCIAYDNRVHIDQKEKLIWVDTLCKPEKLYLLPENREEFAEYDCFPPSLFMKAIEGENIDIKMEVCKKESGDILDCCFGMTLKPGEIRNLKLVIGISYCKEQKNANLLTNDMLQKMEVTNENIHEDGAYAHLWKQFLPKFEEESDEQLRQEMIWNDYVLECMATYHAYFKETFIPQGSVYAYHLGQNASNRDHLQHLLPMIYTDQALAKSCIRFAMKHTRKDGEICREDIGYGYCEPGIYMESDAQIYMFMAVGEYLRITGDTGFLDEKITVYPVEDGREETVISLLTKQFIYLRDTVGRGKHGLVRMLNSDWSDSFFHKYSPNIYWQDAESHLNTTMVLAVIPTLILGLREYAKQSKKEKCLYETEALQLAEAIKQYRESVKNSFMADIEGKTYAPRCYISNQEDSKFKFGINSLCLEAQTFLLQMEDFTVERKKTLMDEIKKRVLNMERFGARTRETPIWDKDGHGEDGGIWFSHQGALMIGMATIDKKEALKLLKRLTFHHYAEIYPDYWVGQWTFADSIESTLSDREGLYHFWVPDAFWPYCAHAHAWMLYCYYRIVKDFM